MSVNPIQPTRPTLRSALLLASYELPILAFATIQPLIGQIPAIGVTFPIIIILTIIETYAFPDDKFHTFIFFIEFYAVALLVLIELLPPPQEFSLRVFEGQAIALHVVLLWLWSLAFRRTTGSEEGALENWCGILLGMRDGFHKANTDLFRALGALFMLLLDIIHFRWDLPSSPSQPLDETMRTSPRVPRETNKGDPIVDAIVEVNRALLGLFLLVVDLVFLKWDLQAFNEFQNERDHSPGAPSLVSGAPDQEATASKPNTTSTDLD